MEINGCLVLVRNFGRNVFDDWRNIWRGHGDHQVVQRDQRITTLVLCRQFELCLSQSPENGTRDSYSFYYV